MARAMITRMGTRSSSPNRTRRTHRRCSGTGCVCCRTIAPCISTEPPRKLHRGPVRNVMQFPCRHRAQLWSAFEAEDTILLAHFWNHYAMIFAMREWTDGSTGERHMQMLTAKPAQRPCRWIDWRGSGGMRSWLLQWRARSSRLEPIAHPSMCASSPSPWPKPRAASDRLLR